MEDKPAITGFKAPVCSIHKREQDLLVHVCFRFDCNNNFKPACSECLNESNTHRHDVSGKYYKPILKTLEELEKLATADIPSNIVVISEDMEFETSKHTISQLQLTSEQ